ncbi:MAG TPA: hypothetical protein VMF53_10815 [Alphaproteobacteria bacterium]|nr:hypothetical protein [Alphaproteobacteria bacterium]
MKPRFLPRSARTPSQAPRRGHVEADISEASLRPQRRAQLATQTGKMPDARITCAQNASVAPISTPARRLRAEFFCNAREAARAAACASARAEDVRATPSTDISGNAACVKSISRARTSGVGARARHRARKNLRVESHPLDKVLTESKIAT